MMNKVEVTVRVFSEAGTEVVATVVQDAKEVDPRLAAFAAVQECGPELAKQLELSNAEAMKVLAARMGALSRQLPELFRLSK